MFESAWLVRLYGTTRKSPTSDTIVKFIVLSPCILSPYLRSLLSHSPRSTSPPLALSLSPSHPLTFLNLISLSETSEASVTSARTSSPSRLPSSTPPPSPPGPPPFHPPSPSSSTPSSSPLSFSSSWVSSSLSFLVHVIIRINSDVRYFL